MKPWEGDGRVVHLWQPRAGGCTAADGDTLTWHVREQPPLHLLAGDLDHLLGRPVSSLWDKARPEGSVRRAEAG